MVLIHFFIQIKGEFTNIHTYMLETIQCIYYSLGTCSLCVFFVNLWKNKDKLPCIPKKDYNEEYDYQLLPSDEQVAPVVEMRSVEVRFE